VPDEPLLREKARAAIASGALPTRKADRTFGGNGSGAICPVCEEPVTREQVELELEFTRQGAHPGLARYYLHQRCFAAWEFERTKVGRSDSRRRGTGRWLVTLALDRGVFRERFDPTQREP